MWYLRIKHRKWRTQSYDQVTWAKVTKGNLRLVTMSPVPVSVSVIPVNIDPRHRTAATVCRHSTQHMTCHSRHATRYNMLLCKSVEYDHLIYHFLN